MPPSENVGTQNKKQRVQKRGGTGLPQKGINGGGENKEAVAALVLSRLRRLRGFYDAERQRDPIKEVDGEEETRKMEGDDEASSDKAG